MSVKIITGYTGERHITPYMDAAINRGIFGEDGCILATGGQLAASMPTINSFVMQDGAFSIQGHLAQCAGITTLAVDTCATGSNRIDLVVARFTHNTETLIDGIDIVLVKGEETTSAYPTTPSINGGDIADGLSVVDMVLYKITLSGSDVTFKRMVKIHAADVWEYNDTREMVSVNSNSAVDTGYNATREDTGVGVFFGVGKGGINHGVWSRKLNKWLIYGDGDYTNLPSPVKIGGCVVAQNQVLWTGAWYMTGTHKITNLKQRVSAQANGIVLVWSAYANNAAQNYDWVYKFVPKWHVSAHSGNGIDMTMANGNFSQIGSKYVYVSDSTITGYETNADSGTRNGITYNNAHWVLRAVIGV